MIKNSIPWSDGIAGMAFPVEQCDQELLYKQDGVKINKLFFKVIAKF